MSQDRREPEVLPAELEVETPAVPEASSSSSERAVGPVDALSAYMAQLGKHAPISREEEHELAVRWAEEGDVEAGRRLVLSNLRLVVKIAMEYRRAWTNVLDLIQDGNVGLMEAVQRYDPYRGVKLSSYAAYWIRAYILKYILDNFRIVRLGTTRAQRKLFFRLNKEKRELERRGFDIEPKLLAERLDVDESDLIEMDRTLSASDQSLQAPAQRDGESGAEFGDFLSRDEAGTDESVGDAELRQVFMEKVGEFKETLGERDRTLIEERILAEEPRTLAELGEDFGISRERVRQLEARIVKRLREYMQEELVDFEYYATPRRD
ncbi:MAG: RNA polymerase factor sigma-32 [Myxococcota bacterium]